MKKFLLLAFLFSFISLKSQNETPLTVKWKEGLVFQNPDKSFSVKFGGRIQYDVMFINEDDTLQKYFQGNNGSEFRRARLYTKGTLYKFIKYKFQVDFAPGKVVIKDAYLQFTKIPAVGNLRIGHFKEPFGFEMSTSSNFITMMERPLANRFDFDRALGFMVYNHHFNKRFSWYAGVFHPDHNLGVYRGKQYNLTARITGLPVYNTGEKYRVLHLGAGYSFGDDNAERLIFKTSPESHLAPHYLHLDIDKVNSTSTFKGELAMVLGLFSLEGEYTAAAISVPEISVLQDTKYMMDAYFVTVSWFLTGEHKNYNPSKGAFDRLTPAKNLGKNGIGAIELALRYSSIDFNDKDIVGGQMDDITAGLNWYLNPVTKITFNYINTNIKSFMQMKDSEGRANIFQMRFQVTF